jgi:hypothetical protein
MEMTSIRAQAKDQPASQSWRSRASKEGDAGKPVGVGVIQSPESEGDRDPAA